MKKNSLLALGVALILISCDQVKEAKQAIGAIEAKKAVKSAIKRVINEKRITNGEKIFAEYCAYCHGKAAEGDPDWKTQGPTGILSPPPLNGSGHAWHHSMSVLFNYIKDGSLAKGGSMAPYATTLSDREIKDVIAWFQSKWPDEIYNAWAETNQRDKK